MIYVATERVGTPEPQSHYHPPPLTYTHACKTPGPTPPYIADNIKRFGSFYLAFDLWLGFDVSNIFFFLLSLMHR